MFQEFLNNSIIQALLPIVYIHPSVLSEIDKGNTSSLIPFHNSFYNVIWFQKEIAINWRYFKIDNVLMLDVRWKLDQ